MPNSFGTVVRDFTGANFIARRHNENHEYQPELVIQRCNSKHEIMFGTLFNYVQYFAEVGGFDALLDLLKMGCTGVSKADVSAVASGSEGAAAVQMIDTSVPGSSAQLPFKMMTWLLQMFSHLNNVFSPDFSKQLT